MDVNYTPLIRIPSRVVVSEPKLKKIKRKCTLDFSLPKVVTKNVDNKTPSCVSSRKRSSNSPESLNTPTLIKETTKSIHNITPVIHRKKRQGTPDCLFTPLKSSLTTPGKRKFDGDEEFCKVKRFKKDKDKSIVPMYENYQLLGDSQFMRFSEKLLSLKVEFLDGFRRIGYCVSGQKIENLRQRLQEQEFNIHSHVIVLIGTNDFIQRTEHRLMCASYTRMLQFLKQKCSKIILLTVPPVAKFENDKKHWKLLEEFNRFIGEFADGERVEVIDLCSIFISYSNTVSKNYYEKVYFNPTRPDLIHLNEKGFKMLKCLIDLSILEDKKPTQPLNRQLF